MSTTYQLPTINSTWCNVPINGEYYHRDEIRKAAYASNSESANEYFFKVALVCEPDNPYSKSGKAISVRNGNDILGYIPSDVAKTYYPEIARICASGTIAETNARLWISGDLFSPDPRMDLSIALLAPGLNVPLNNPPLDGWGLIPYGKPIQVTKESDHFDVLQDYVPESGKGPLFVTLHKANLGAKNVRVGVEVRLDGERIGELTKVSGEKMLPAIEHLDAQGLDAVCYATIQGSAIAAEVTLHLLRANEMDDESLNPEVAPLPQLVPFEPDPDDYNVPDAYISQRDDAAIKPSPEEKRFEQQTAAYVEPVAFSTPTASHPWEMLLNPDDSERATPFQRGYVRGKIGQHFPGNKAPRIDYATVDQCANILRYFDKSPAPLTQQGRGSKALWWTLMVVVFFLVALLSNIPLIGPVIAFIWLAVILHHFVTRRGLKGPFGKQT
ncbi:MULTISPECIES: hypothetical protein [Corynebacterium]|uniref:hypothetical protein n=1 Tax=Corynebacterium TaxID=1716 RepID=UPI0011CC7DFC|nr:MULTISPECIES: hypothetical protein [Corynebacterium]MCG7247498.1 hypothetical protein [Corynebacterium simulans]TXS64595.1 hypothetical protein CHU71_04210 [Corynebacterium sp. LK14]HAT1145401.1 hypothetical protein [Corynebacterium striatum]HAT1158761.1 hypothetical protein [Corynebacterium striatum]HAT1161466.1 hypothetical protein [Corynebacterium striatum]